ncbi:neuromedin Bb [Gouania willdenowi]|uniref:Neuromedin-B-like n=1 Tax=Gouania willdenowi TaxID=441366 RepID=A0A8C5DAB1_GOUWI|nr:neuromedin-B-like [Gouania willdenowi]
MRGLTLNTVCQSGMFAYFMLFSFVSFTAAVSFDLTELRNKVAKIKVNPRGNLWATGHFMGKKSVMEAPLLPSSEDQSVDALQLPVAAYQSALGELFHDFLRVALQTQLEDQNLSKTQEGELLMKVIENYIQNKK